jgi:methionine-R-sulfoxide reductase
MSYDSLTPEEKRVIEGGDTETPFSGKYVDFYPPEGIFVCKRCNNPLFTAQAKFDAHCGWPAFEDSFEDSVVISKDYHRVFGAEVTCANCGAHLGHTYFGEGFTDSNVRHCVNSLSIKFIPKDE